MSSGVLQWVEVSDGPRLATWTWQAGQPTWLLVHGLASNARLWDGMANILSSLGQTVISVDQRGHGLSDRPEGGYDFATISSDLAAVIDNVIDAPVIAVGQSWGANVVLELAARRPDLVSSVVGIDGGFIELSASFEDWESAAATLRPPDLPPITWAAATEQAASFYPGFPPDGVLAQLANLEEGVDGRVRRRLPLEAHMTILRHLFEQRPLDTAAKLGQPVLIVAARNNDTGDKAQRAQALEAALAQGRLVWLEGHHDLHAQRPQKVVDVVVGALSEGFLK